MSRRDFEASLRYAVREGVITEGQAEHMRQLRGERVERNRLVAHGRKLYGVCAGCNRLVRVNKPLLGSAHVCV